MPPTQFLLPYLKNNHRNVKMQKHEVGKAWQTDLVVPIDGEALLKIMNKLKLTPSPTLNLGMQFSRGCSSVIIAGKFLGKVNEVMRKVDNITEDMEFIPSVVFILLEEENQNIVIDERKVNRKYESTSKLLTCNE